MIRYYGKCERCGTNLTPGETAIVDEEKIYNGKRIKTGKKIYIIGYLECPHCLKKYTIDDSFDRYVS